MTTQDSTPLTDAQLDEIESDIAVCVAVTEVVLGRDEAQALVRAVRERDAMRAEVEGLRLNLRDAEEERDAARAEAESLKAKFELHRISVASSARSDAEETVDTSDWSVPPTPYAVVVAERDAARAEARGSEVLDAWQIIVRDRDEWKRRCTLAEGAVASRDTEYHRLNEAQAREMVRLRDEVNRLEIEMNDFDERLVKSVRELAESKWQVANWERKEIDRATCCEKNRADAERFLTQAHNAEGALVFAQAEVERLETVAEERRGRAKRAEAEIERLRVRAEKAEAALDDIATNGAIVQCIVAHLGEGTMECRHDRVCVACRAGARVDRLRAVADATVFHVAQLRHLYAQMVAGDVLDARRAADGLLAPAIAAFEAVELEAARE